MNIFTLKNYLFALIMALVPGGYTKSNPAEVTKVTVQATETLKTADDVKKYVHTCVENLTGYVKFTLTWTDEFFSKKNNKPYTKYIDEMNHAVNKFSADAQLLEKHLKTTLQTSPYKEAMTIAHDIVSGLLVKAKHVCQVLNQHRTTKNSLAVGIAMKQLEKYTSTKAINELQEKFEKFKAALRKVDLDLTAKVAKDETAIISHLRKQHDRSYAELIGGLGYRIKCA